MIEINKADDISILSLYGELTLLELEVLERTIQSFKKSQQYKILLDFAEVDHVHFEVTRRLAEHSLLFRLRHGDIKLANMNDNTREVFKFTGADQYMEDYASKADAILSFLRCVQVDDHLSDGSQSSQVGKTGKNRGAGREYLFQ